MASGLSGILHCTINPVCRSQWPRGLRRGSAAARFPGYWEFQSRRERRCLFLVSVMCCQVEISARGRSIVQRSRTRFGVPEWDGGTSWRRLKPTRCCWAIKKHLALGYKTLTSILICRYLLESTWERWFCIILLVPRQFTWVTRKNYETEKTDCYKTEPRTRDLLNTKKTSTHVTTNLGLAIVIIIVIITHITIRFDSRCCHWNFPVT